jgi:hypothetical protein
MFKSLHVKSLQVTSLQATSLQVTSLQAYFTKVSTLNAESLS